jgi:hypothetical protein
MITKLCNYFLCEYANKIQDKWPGQRTRAHVGPNMPVGAICLPKLPAPRQQVRRQQHVRELYLESLMMCRM